MNALDFTHAFREAAPYIHYLRGKTLVVAIQSDLLSGSLNALAADFNLIAALGVRLVLVHGSEQPLRQLSAQTQYVLSQHENRFVMDKQGLTLLSRVCGQIQAEIQAALSLGFRHALYRSERLRIASGNYLTAKPVGVINGVDMQFAGLVRKVDRQAIEHQLNNQAIVLISPIATSPVGQTYHLSMHDTAQAVAVALHAEKLVFLTDETGILDDRQALIQNLTAQEAQQMLTMTHLSSTQRQMLATAMDALQQGIKRVQILSGRQNGSLINELFTRQGSGTSIAQNAFMKIRPANERDIADIIALIHPLAQRGILLPRNRAYLENHIHEFSVVEHDEQIYACVALKTFADMPDAVELACLVVSEEVRAAGYGDALLDYVVAQACKMGKRRLFALSTQTADWFLEHDFQAAQLADLPPARQQQYLDNQRQSKIFVRSIS